jgi:hypothetical protein
MIGLSVDAKDAMLSLFSGKMFEIALFVGEDEVADSLYSRREVQLSMPVVIACDTSRTRTSCVSRVQQPARYRPLGTGGYRRRLVARYRTLDPVTGSPSSLEVSP